MGGIFNPYDDTNLLALIAIIDGLCDSILEDTIAIREVTDAEPILSEFSNEITTDGTEQTVVTQESPAGILRPVCFKIDMTNHTAAETVKLRVYYRINPTGNMIKQIETTCAGAQDPNLININLEPNRFGFKVTIEKTAGNNRDYDYELFYEEAP